jgi:hypothetical protein
VVKTEFEFHFDNGVSRREDFRDKIRARARHPSVMRVLLPHMTATPGCTTVKLSGKADRFAVLDRRLAEFAYLHFLSVYFLLV